MTARSANNNVEQILGLPVDDFMSLPVDRRALALLKSARSGFSAYNWMLGLHQAGLEYRSPTMTAAAEAWQWLNTHGLVVPTYKQPNGYHYVVTPRGQAALEDADGFLADEAARQRLDVELVDELRSARSIFLMGEYETAVFTAMKAVEVTVRDRASLGENVVGVKLMRRAFGPGGPLSTDGLVEAEEKARADLYSGAIGLLRNPPAHRVVDYDDPTEAAEAVLFADLLLRMIKRI